MPDYLRFDASVPRHGLSIFPLDVAPCIHIYYVKLRLPFLTVHGTQGHGLAAGNQGLWS